MPNLPKNAEDNKLTTQFIILTSKCSKLKLNHKPQEISFTAKFEYFDVICTVDKIIYLGKLLSICFLL